MRKEEKPTRPPKAAEEITVGFMIGKMFVPFELRSSRQKSMGEPPRRFAQNPVGIGAICGARVIPTSKTVVSSFVPDPGSHR